MTTRAAAAIAIAALATACTGTAPAGEPAPALSPNPARSELVARAGLDACPTSGRPAAGSAATDRLPDVALPCLGAGPSVDLARLSGRPTVLNVWGSWCGPCQQEAPYLAQVYAQVKGAVRFLGVDDEDDPGSALDFAAHVRPRLRYPSVVDDDKRVLLALQAGNVPLTAFLTASGAVAHLSFGPYRSAASLRDDIARYLGVRTTAGSVR